VSFFRSLSSLSPLAVLLAGALSAPASCAAAVHTATARSGNAIQLGAVTYRLDSVDAPEPDQVCISEHAEPWTCGMDARDQLAVLIRDHDIHCTDIGPEKRFGRRRRATCFTEGDRVSINEHMLQAGFAIVREHAGAKLRLAASEAQAASRGIWKGCFAAPRDFRAGRKENPLLGASCRADRDREIRAALFPQSLTMPQGCTIKANRAIRAHLTGNIGIYQLRGCPGYAAATRPDRWFCSEDDATAAGYRRAFNCRNP